MLVDWFLDRFGSVLTGFGGALPEASSDGWWTGFSGVFTHLADLNYYLPITELFTFVVGFTAVYIVLGPVKLALWLLTWFRGGGES